MHVTLKVLIAVLVSGVVWAAHAELVFEQTELELNPAVGDETAVGHFKYQNKGDKAVAIKSVTTSCGCTAASAKQSADPGEKGEVTATFKIGDRTGVQQKAITVLTDDTAHPSTTLTLKVVIPTVLEIQPTFVYWQPDEAPNPKTILAKAAKDVSIKKLDVSSSNPDFLTKVEPGSSANEFRISVEPKKTNQLAAATLTIKPDLSKGQPKFFYATARVLPKPVATQPSAVSSPGAASPPAPLPITNLTKSKIDACALLTGKEIEAVQNEPLKDTKASGRSTSGFALSQCYFTLPTGANSISLTIMQKGDGTDARDPRQYWQELFHREKAGDKERKEEEKESARPEKVEGIGDEAFWSVNRVGGELYVLKLDIFIRISVGGSGDAASKLKKCRALAEMALKRI
jgi:hypothetical protein